ncbi:MAG TPA: response regulator [Anaerolineales bacterium]|nr:response regulator [Anaerolineales bacterium]
MNGSAEHILLVESDPDIRELIVYQALQPLGYQVQVADDASAAIMQAAKESPDLVIVDLNLIGLSGKDLLVAFNSQGLQVPVIVIAEKGQENQVIQAFRLGGTDYLLWPARETEVVSAVERALKQVRERRARQRLDLQLKETNQELQRTVRELTTIFAVGKAVISITNQQVLFDKIVEGMVYVADADCGWLLLREERTKAFILTAQRYLPDSWAKKKGQTLDDGISSLVALSGETLAINGEPLKRFKLSMLGHSAIAVPVKIHQEVIGLLVVVRKADRAFEGTVQSLLEAVADYTSISLVNTHLFRALQEGAGNAQAGEKKIEEQLLEMQREMQTVLQSATYPLELLLAGKIGKLSQEQKKALETVQSSLSKARQLSTPQRDVG